MPWLDRIRRKHLGKPGNLGQIRQHWAAKASHKLQKQLAARLERAYDIVHVEHPWGIELIGSMRHHPMLTHARIVYSSHNIEHELFESITREQGHWNRAAQQLAKEIRQVEEAAAATADVTWAVSLADAAQIAPFSRHCIVAPNGCRELPIHAPPSLFSDLRGRYALFIGANYTPNINGFLNMLGNDLSFLPAGTAIHTIGTCAEALKLYAPHQPWMAIDKIHHHGKVSTMLLDSALLNAGVILLPIISGGGTNLKTAEALAAGRPVLGTSKAFRGFEVWLRTPGIHLADHPDVFRDNLAKLLAIPATGQTASRIQGLSWMSTLRPAVEETLKATLNSTS